MIEMIVKICEQVISAARFSCALSHHRSSCGEHIAMVDPCHAAIARNVPPMK
jgi:hypothetical protein